MAEFWGLQLDGRATEEKAKAGLEDDQGGSGVEGESFILDLQRGL